MHEILMGRSVKYYNTFAFTIEIIRLLQKNFWLNLLRVVR